MSRGNAIIGRLVGRVAIVSGAANGIGKAIAMRYADEGAMVAIVDRDAANAEALHRQLNSAGQAARLFPIDLRDYAAVARACDELVQEFGRINVLVNNAAIAHNERFLTSTLEEWRHVLHINLEATYVMSQLAAKHMTRDGGRIINIASIQGLMSSGAASAYNAAKAGLLGLNRAMAVELASYGIIVNAVAPGFVRAGLSIRADGVDETTTPEFERQYLRGGRIPLARVGLPEDVAAVAAFLASDDCRYMTGQTLIVDGGLSVTI
jgi:3-oxoacyl-[acyl-carrier protein] reductase